MEKTHELTWAAKNMSDIFATKGISKLVSLRTNVVLDLHNERMKEERTNNLMKIKGKSKG